MPTAYEIVTESMQEIGAIGINEVPSAAEATKVLRAMNRMLEAWKTEGVMVYNIESAVFDYVANQASYTIGTGGNFNVERPVEIVAAFNRIGNGTQAQIDIPIDVTTNYEDYAYKQAKLIGTSIPLLMYDDGNYPLKNLTFWPVPTITTYQPVLWFWRALSDNFTLANDTVFPPAYERAIVKNLSLEIAPSFGANPSQLLMSQAMQSKMQVQRINFQTPMLAGDFLTQNRPLPNTRALFYSGYF